MESILDTDLTVFWLSWQKIQDKIQQIVRLPEVHQLDMVGEDFEGYIIDLICDKVGSGTITYRSSTWYSYGTEHYYCTVHIEDLNKPLDWFQKHFQLIIEKHIEDELKKRLAMEEESKQIELEQLAALKKKYFNE